MLPLPINLSINIAVREYLLAVLLYGIHYQTLPFNKLLKLNVVNDIVEDVADVHLQSRFLQLAVTNPLLVQHLSECV